MTTATVTTEFIEIATPTGLATVRAKVVGCFAVNECDGYYEDAEDGVAEPTVWVPTYVITHTHSGYGLTSIASEDEEALVQACIALCADPEIFAWFNENDVAEAVSAAVDPAVKRRVGDILRTAFRGAA
ncbi:MAG TPA: hypothetical protein VIL85_16685 [Thermomicrobiales bacterium]|jgi:hypothetical protein